MDTTALLKKMTLRQKLSQLTQLDSSFFLKYGTSELTGPLHGMNIKEEDVACCGSVLGAIGADVTREIQEKHLAADPLKIPVLFMLDVIHGFRTIFPINLGLACAWEPETARQAAEISAKEAAASGIHVSFAPMEDLVRDPRWGRVMESTGEDPYLNSLYSAAFVKGFQGNDPREPDRVAACIKHIAGYGAAEAGRDYNTTEIGLNTLFEFYMPAYRAAVDAGAAMAMASFNAHNGVPSTANRWLLNDILRKKWGFKGTVISDWGAVEELRMHGVAKDRKEAAYKALNAGIDIEMMTSDYLQFGEELVREGKINEAEIDAAVLRVLDLKDRLGLFEDPYRSASADNEKLLLLCEEHRKAACEAAAKSMVLLENSGILPLKKGMRVALIGPFAEGKDILGGWGCTGRFDETVSVYDAVKASGYFSEVTAAYCAGFDGADDAELEKAVKTAENSDVAVLLIGEHQDMSGEAASRTDISLPAAQKKLFDKIVKTGKPVITVIFSGRPLLLSETAERSEALIQAWFPGTEGGRAVADLITGKTEPQGRLTMSFPRNMGQIPLYYNAFSTGRPVTGENPAERYLSKYIDSPNTPLYPFGYGLSYSHTEISEVSCEVSGDKATVTAEVKNTGERETTETVQIYIKDMYASVVRPVKQLKAFKKVRIMPGESKKIIFELGRESFSFCKEDGDLHFEGGR